MTDPQDFHWPLPTTLDDKEVKLVYVGLVAGAAAMKVNIVDRPTHYMAALAEATSQFIAEELERRGVPRGTFEDIEPEDFNDDSA